MEQLFELWRGTGIYQLQLDQLVMIGIGMLLLYLAIARGFEPLLLVPIGFGGILSNIPGVDIAVGDGILHQFYMMGKNIFSRWETTLSWVISIFRSSSVVRSRMMGGCIRGTRAI